MYLVCLLSLLVGSAGFPVGEIKSEYAGRQFITLGKGVDFSWRLIDSDIEMKIHVDNIITWVVVGFQIDPPTSRVEDLALIFIKHKGRYDEEVIVKSIHLTNNHNLAASRKDLYKLNDAAEEYSPSNIVVSRQIGMLSITQPIKLLWAYGTETSYSGISQSFEERIQSGYIILSVPNVISFSSPAKETIPSPTETLDVASNYEKRTPPIEINNSEKTGKENINNNKNINSKQSEREESSENEVLSIPTTTTTKATIVQLGDKKWEDISFTTDSLKTANLTTPCPTPKCNCVTVPSHWYDNLNDSVYMVIIGAAALLTGIIVLCIACCCARSKSRQIPKTRKHKVAFYKVDDFDSANEEIEFLKDEDKPKHKSSSSS